MGLWGGEWGGGGMGQWAGGWRRIGVCLVEGKIDRMKSPQKLFEISNFLLNFSFSFFLPLLYAHASFVSYISFNCPSFSNMVYFGGEMGNSSNSPAPPTHPPSLSFEPPDFVVSPICKVGFRGKTLWKFNLFKNTKSKLKILTLKIFSCFFFVINYLVIYLSIFHFHGRYVFTHCGSS